jgi:hypothetical protein
VAGIYTGYTYLLMKAGNEKVVVVSTTRHFLKGGNRREDNISVDFKL